MNITHIRDNIDQIDNEIIKLLSERSVLVKRAGTIKKSEKAVRDPKRVEQVIRKVKKKALKEGLDPMIAESIYRSIIDCFIDREMVEFRKEKPYFPDI